MYKLLDGIKIVDLTHVLAGPYCAYQLSLLGADITRIENPASVDLPRILDADPGRRDKGMGAAFIAANSNKRSVAFDLSHEKDQELARQLIANADVVLENFRPGVLKRTSVYLIKKLLNCKKLEWSVFMIRQEKC
jgi:CoA:oxalate CoA-transferase